MGNTKVIIFSGTTEGRKLSDMLAARKIKHIVCVASEYGMIVMNENGYADVRVGRLDSDDMKKLFSEEGDKETVIVDATHPYAAVVTENIRKVSEEMNLGYLRIIRDSSDMNGLIYEDMEAMKAALSNILCNSNENVLLTTGSKDLHILCGGLGREEKNRLFVRVLPSTESINICLDNGIEPGHIIAMQGPFSKEMNIALLKQFGIKHLVTKESGANGGFDEKIAAAEECDAVCHIIARKQEAGVHVEEAYEMLVNEFGTVPECDEEIPCKPELILIGRGMGTASTLTCEAREAVEKADVVFGAARLISDIECQKKYEMYRAEDIIPVLEKDRTLHKAVVLLSGDSGFYSGAALLKNKLKDVADVRLMAGISSVSYMAAKTGESYHDACICSLHGRNDAVNTRIVVNNILQNKKTFVLLSGPEDVRTLGYELEKRLGANEVMGLAQKSNLSTEQIRDSISFYIGINLSYEYERIEKLTLSEAQTFDGKGVMIGFIENELFAMPPLIKTIRDDEFIREKVPMTKEYIRHASIAELGLKKGDVVYDIGGGTGSVAIEIAMQDSEIRVYTIEKKREAVELIKRNIEKFDAANIKVIEGSAPEALADLAPCDAVFIGGSSGRLADILEIVKNKKSSVRVVINAVSVETICEVNALLKTIDATEVRAVQLSATEVKEIGNYHMMQANNPVMIYSFTLK